MDYVLVETYLRGCGLCTSETYLRGCGLCTSGYVFEKVWSMY